MEGSKQRRVQATCRGWATLHGCPDPFSVLFPGGPNSLHPGPMCHVCHVLLMAYDTQRVSMS